MISERLKHRGNANSCPWSALHAWRAFCHNASMTMHEESANEKGWIILSLVLVGFFTLLQVMQWWALPRFVDIYYHLSVAEGFRSAGGYVSTAFWENAPVGRPHVYAPLFHVMLMGLLGTGLGYIAAARVAECCLLPLFLLSIWALVRRLYSARTAFFAVLVLGSSLPFVLATVILGPFTLSMSLGLLAVLALAGRGRTGAATILLGLGFYAHAMMGLINLLVFLLCAVARPRERRRFLVAALGAVIMSLPLLFHLGCSAPYISMVRVRENRLVQVDPSLYLLATVGVWLTVRHRRTVDSCAVCLAIAAVPIAFTHPVRFTGGHGMVGFGCLAAIALDRLAGVVGQRINRGQTAVAVTALLYFSFLAPVLHVRKGEADTTLRVLDRSVSHWILPASTRAERVTEHSIYFPGRYEEIAQVVQENTDEDDIIWSDFAYGGGIVALLSRRATSSAMMSEVRPYHEFDEISASAVQIWFKSASRDVQPRMMLIADTYGLEPIAETELAYIFRSPTGGAKVRPAKPVISSGWLVGILVLLAALVVMDWSVPRPTDLAIQTGP